MKLSKLNIQGLYMDKYSRVSDETIIISAYKRLISPQYLEEGLKNAL